MDQSPFKTLVVVAVQKFVALPLIQFYSFLCIIINRNVVVTKLQVEDLVIYFLVVKTFFSNLTMVLMLFFTSITSSIVLLIPISLRWIRTIIFVIIFPTATTLFPTSAIILPWIVVICWTSTSILPLLLFIPLSLLLFSPLLI